MSHGTRKQRRKVKWWQKKKEKTKTKKEERKSDREFNSPSPRCIVRSKFHRVPRFPLFTVRICAARSYRRTRRERGTSASAVGRNETCCVPHFGLVEGVYNGRIMWYKSCCCRRGRSDLLSLLLLLLFLLSRHVRAALFALIVERARLSPAARISIFQCVRSKFAHFRYTGGAGQFDTRATYTDARVRFCVCVRANVCVFFCARYILVHAHVRSGVTSLA